MDRNVVLKKIERLGFTRAEAAVYLAALETGTAPASAIAKTAGMNRVTAYTLLLRLIKSGAMTSAFRARVQVFTAVRPEQLLVEHRQRVDDLATIVPALLALSGGHPARPVVRVFHDIDGVKAAYRETLSARTEILNYANSKNIRAHWPTYDEDYVRARAEKKIFLRGLAPDDPQGRAVKKADSAFFREMRLLPRKHFWVENEIKIWDDKFLIASFEPAPVAILIESTPIVATQRQIFEIAWEYGKDF